MIEVGLFEAKTKLSEYVERAERGEEIVITRRGKPVARLTAVSEAPVSQADRWAALRAARDQVIDSLRAKGRPPVTREEIKAWIEAGRE